ncbi:hypothetical protein C0J52_11168 [Blattella germanica]|nr:hypothetical protein C0J52_11168 [Blattella germanica]
MLGETLCKLRALGSEMSNYTSILTIVAFSTERYLAICQPIQSYTTSSPRIAIRVIAVLWVVSLLCAMPFAIYTKINYVEYPPGSEQLAAESAFCAMLEHAMPENWPMYELSAFVFFLGPMLIIVVLYARMGCLYFFSCTVNPVLYNVMSAKYRLAFRKTLCCGQRKGGPTREPSTLRDTTVVYVNSHLERGRSISSHREVRPMRSFSRNCKNVNIPNNVMMDRTSHHNLLHHNSTLKTHPQDYNNEKLLDPNCDLPYNDQVSDVIVTLSPTSKGKTNSFTTSKTWSKALLRIAKPSKSQVNDDICDVTEPCLKQIDDSRQNNSQYRGETTI